MQMEVLYPLQELQRNRNNRLKREPPAAPLPQGLDILAELLKDQVGALAGLEGLLDLGKSVKMRLFQFLICMDLVLDQPRLALRIALDDVVAAILPHAFLDYLIPAVLHHLHLLVFTLYHQYNIDRRACPPPRFIYSSASSAPARPPSSGSCWPASSKRGTPSFRTSLLREKWALSSR